MENIHSPGLLLIYSTQGGSIFWSSCAPWYIWELGRKRSVWRVRERHTTHGLLVALFLYRGIISHWKPYGLWQQLFFSWHVCLWSSAGCFLCSVCLLHHCTTWLHSLLDSGRVCDLILVMEIAGTWLFLHVLYGSFYILSQVSNPPGTS